jgi:hypothetical protein
LPKLSQRELLALAKLLGCPSCGSKETIMVRLLAQRELRLKLARFTDDPKELAISYKRESLRDMCREAGIWRSGNKRALSAGHQPTQRSRHPLVLAVAFVNWWLVSANRNSCMFCGGLEFLPSQLRMTRLQGPG